MYKKIMKVLSLQYLFVFSAALVLYGQALLCKISAGDKEVVTTSLEETQPETRPCELVTKTIFTSPNEIQGSGEPLQKQLPDGEEELIEERESEVQGFTLEEISVLERIVEAEAGGEDRDGKLLVANVVLNRVRNEQFPNTIREVVFQQSGGVTQFSPVKNGRYDSVTISEESKEAVERALAGEDISEGALYFAARKYANPKSMTWFDENLTLLFQHGGHEFFK